jgi:hypothetical protein
VTINSPGSEKFSKHVVEGGDGAALVELLSRISMTGSAKPRSTNPTSGLWLSLSLR